MRWSRAVCVCVYSAVTLMSLYIPLLALGPLILVYLGSVSLAVAEAWQPQRSRHLCMTQWGHFLKRQLSLLAMF